MNGCICPGIARLPQKMDSSRLLVECFNMEWPHIVAGTDDIFLGQQKSGWRESTVVSECQIAIRVCCPIDMTPEANMLFEVLIE